jgi:Zn-dependent protease
VKWSFKFARFFGIDIYIHQTFFLLLLYFGWQGYSQQGDIAQAASGVLFIVALFACVVLHEYGHALVARRFGVKTSHITLLPIGGVASMQKIPEKPSQELLIAIAGPMVNIIIAIGLYFWLQISPQGLNSNDVANGNMPFILQLLIVNVFLAGFNLIPAFPMDGGRILRALLAMKLNYAKATQWASYIGRGFSAAFALYGMLSGNYMLVLIAVFLWLGAMGENKAAQFKQQVKQLSIAHIMEKNFTILAADDSLATVQRIAAQSPQRDFPIGNKQCINFVLSAKDLQQALEKHDHGTTLQQLELAAVLNVDIQMDIQHLIARLSETPYKMVSVTSQGHVVGIIGMQQILALAEM